MTDFKFNVGDRVKFGNGTEFSIIARHDGPVHKEYWCVRIFDGRCAGYFEEDLTLAPPEQRDFMGAWAWAKEGKTIKRLSNENRYRFNGQCLGYAGRVDYHIALGADHIEATDWVLA